jgi:FG-GAP-like repeat
VSNFLSNNVGVFLNNGGGTFAGAVFYAVGASPVGISVADYNMDGDLDLSVACFGSNGVYTLLGTAGGTFAAAVYHGLFLFLFVFVYTH